MAVVLTAISCLGPVCMCQDQDVANPNDQRSRPVDAHRMSTGDVVKLSVWREPNISGSKVVRPDGEIDMALVGAVYVLGLTPSQLQDLLTEKLKRFVSAPRVTVDVVARQEPATRPGRPQQEWRLPDIWPIA